MLPPIAHPSSSIFRTLPKAKHLLLFPHVKGSVKKQDETGESCDADGQKRIKLQSEILADEINKLMKQLDDYQASKKRAHRRQFASEGVTSVDPPEESENAAEAEEDQPKQGLSKAFSMPELREHHRKQAEDKSNRPVRNKKEKGIRTLLEEKLRRLREDEEAFLELQHRIVQYRKESKARTNGKDLIGHNIRSASTYDPSRVREAALDKEERNRLRVSQRRCQTELDHLFRNAEFLLGVPRSTAFDGRDRHTDRLSAALLGDILPSDATPLFESAGGALKMRDPNKLSIVPIPPLKLQLRTPEPIP